MRSIWGKKAHRASSPGVNVALNKYPFNVTRVVEVIDYGVIPANSMIISSEFRTIWLTWMATAMTITQQVASNRVRVASKPICAFLLLMTEV